MALLKITAGSIQVITMTQNKLITSKEILAQTGISRATLNNYIKLGILPRPIVSTPGPEQQGVKQIGFFPAEALIWIGQVKTLKQQGNSMEDIAKLFQDKEWLQSLSAAEPIDPAKERPTEKPQQLSMPVSPATGYRQPGQTGLQVTINELTSPAYMVNNNLEIEWINDQAEELIFHRRISSMVDVEARNIFKLLFDQDLHGYLQNWKEAVDLHCTLLQRHMDSKNLDLVYDGIPADTVALLQEAYRNRQRPATDNLYCLPFTLVDATSGTSQNFLVHSAAYREGTFLVFVPADQNSSHIVDLFAQREKLIMELLQHRMPTMVSLCALVASFYNAEKVCAELLPSQYFLLINELRQTVGPVFEKYYGTYGKCAGDNILYYFIKSRSSDYLRNSINCALELREVMSSFSLQWKNKMGWNHDLSLKIGIHEGDDFLGTVHTGANIEFTTLGNAAKIAGQLSEFAGFAEIWVSKDLITKMSTKDREGFRFGVSRNQGRGKIRQPDSFSLAGDLIGAGPLPRPSFDLISNLAITEITEQTYTPQGTNG